VPLFIRNSAIGRRRKQRSGVDETIEAAERGDHRMQSATNGFAVANIERHREDVFFATRRCHFSCNVLRRFKIAVRDHDMRAALRRLNRSFPPDSAPSANDDEDLTAELLLRRLTAQFGFFQGPVFDAERFRGRQRNIIVFHTKRGVRSRSSRLRQIRVFAGQRKIIMGSPLDFTRENIDQYWF